MIERGFTDCLMLPPMDGIVPLWDGAGSTRTTKFMIDRYHVCIVIRATVRQWLEFLRDRYRVELSKCTMLERYLR